MILKKLRVYRYYYVGNDECNNALYWNSRDLWPTSPHGPHIHIFKSNDNRANPTAPYIYTHHKSNLCMCPIYRSHLHYYNINIDIAGARCVSVSPRVAPGSARSISKICWFDNSPALQQPIVTSVALNVQRSSASQPLRRCPQCTWITSLTRTPNKDQQKQRRRRWSRTLHHWPWTRASPPSTRMGKWWMRCDNSNIFR